MRNYTSKKEKVERYSTKYNLPKEEVHRILTEKEDVLTFDELKIKYDNPDMGKLPDWLTEKELDLIIWKTVHSEYNKNYSNWSSWITKEDLYMELQIWVRKISNLLDNHKTLKVSCVNHLKFLLQNQMVAQNYVSYCLDKDLTADLEDESKESTLLDILPASTSNETDDLEFLDSIDSIKNKEVRDLLIVIGYLYSNITALRGRYLNLLKTCDEATKQGLIQLEQVLEEEDNTQRLKIEGVKPVTKTRSKKLKVQDIVKVMCDLTDMNDLPESTKSYRRMGKLVQVGLKPEDTYLRSLQYYLSNAMAL